MITAAFSNGPWKKLDVLDYVNDNPNNPTLLFAMDNANQSASR